MKTGKNILICPLEWGLGHAARMIPLAVRLREMNYNVIVGSGEEHLALFRSEIPGIPCIDFKGFRPGYSGYIPQYLLILLKTPLLLYHIISEHIRLKKIIRENKIDIVISDNRLGLWNRKIKTVYVTHQLRIPFPRAFRIFEFIGVLLHRAIIRNYSFCFIPDLPGELNLSGRLSHGINLPANTIYIGILSKYSVLAQGTKGVSEHARHNTVILSGPEPQRSILGQKLTRIFENREPLTMILGGRPEADPAITRTDNIIFYTHLPAAGMKEVITGSDKIITRSGYTTVMELVSLNMSAVLIPTPGQTEQEYLASWLQEKGWFTCVLQKNLIDELPDISINKIPSEEMISRSRILLEEGLKRLSE